MKTEKANKTKAPAYRDRTGSAARRMVGVRLDLDHYAALRQRAASSGRTLSQEIEAAVVAWIGGARDDSVPGD